MNSKSCLSLLQFQPQQIFRLLEQAGRLKRGQSTNNLSNKIMGLLFFNPSLRTRMSFEACLARYGGKAIVLSPGNDTWQFESREGVRMDGAAAEHLKEAVAVMSRYCDCLGVRSFAGLKDQTVDAKEEILNAFSKYSTVPVVNLESAMEHPCQALADMLTIREKLGSKLNGRRFVLSWAPHVKPLPMAVPHSALLAAAFLGMDITLTAPSGYNLFPSYLDQAKELCQVQGGVFEYQENQAEALRSADVVYVKSWGSSDLYKDPIAQAESFTRHSNWRLNLRHLERRPNAIFMHCLPLRRNVVVDDELLDSRHSVVIDQAENRLWAQAALLDSIFSS